jgi:polyhydroxybutyrate depolymerase
MKLLFFFSLIPVLAINVIQAQAIKTRQATTGIGPGDFTRTLTVGNQRRSYIVHLPSKYKGNTKLPVLLVFHGGNSNATEWMRLCGLNETAETNHFIAVYPNGTDNIKVKGYEGKYLTWNGGPHGPGGTDTTRSKVDDVAFTRALLTDLATVVRIDSFRIYATGMSMGAIMVYRLASELSDRIAAIAPIAGTMGTQRCTPKRPVSVIHFHGTQDKAVPFEGGIAKLDPSKTDFYPVDYAIQSWVKADGCRKNPQIDTLADKAHDSTSVIRKTYGDGQQGTEVVLYLIQGGGHSWPGKVLWPELAVLGKSTKNVSANEVMWTFFQKHPMKK